MTKNAISILFLCSLVCLNVKSQTIDSLENFIMEDMEDSTNAIDITIQNNWRERVKTNFDKKRNNISTLPLFSSI